MRQPRLGEASRLLRTLLDGGCGGGAGDGVLVARVAAGGAAMEGAFAALVERHGPMVLRVCRGVLRDPHEAQDAFQATFLVLAQRARMIRDPDAVACWLHGVALRAAHTLRTAAARRRRHEQRAAAARRIVIEPDGIGDHDLAAILHEEIGRLSARERAVVVLCDLEGRSQADAARQLACPVGTVKSRLSGARRTLRVRLVRRGLAPAVSGALLAAEAHSAALPWALREAACGAAGAVANGFAGAASGMVPGAVAALASQVIMNMTVRNSVKMLALLAGAFAVSGSLMITHGFQEPPPPTASAPVPSIDRLESMEMKLDKLIQVLERQAGERGPNAYGAPLPRPVPDSPGPPLAQPAPDPNTVRSDGRVALAMPAGANVRIVPDDRLVRLEVQLKSLDERITRLEGKVFAIKPGQGFE